jgi:Ca2+-binding RTX toxin-like protein
MFGLYPVMNYLHNNIKPTNAAYTRIFISTIDGTATNGDDFEGQNKSEIKFKANQKVATVAIDIYTDTLKEGNESFGLNLYKYYSDSIPMVKKNVTLTDAAKAKEYIYEITSDAESEESAESEGSIITFTVTRNGTGTESTVYLKNGLGSALAGADFLDTYPKSLTFKPNEDSLTFTIETLNDDQFESSQVLNIELYTEQVSSKPADATSAYVKNSQSEIYNYAITSTAADSKSAAEEGKDIIFTITRDGNGSESTIYVDTFDGSAAGENEDWSNDYESIYEQKVTFAPDETVKTVTVKTYADSNVDEGEEDLNLGYYLYKTDVEYTDSASAYLKDTIPDNYTYEVSSGDNKFNEGDDITFTITRNAKGTPSTVYLWTTEDTASASDFGEILGEPLTFASNETVKTVTVKTIVDNISDEPVYEDLFLEVYKYYDDENSVAYGDAWIGNTLNKITGGKKAETLVGTKGQDDIYGMEGNDKITGGENQDFLTGGKGNDIFIFKSITDTLPNLGDIVTDFTKGDKIDLKLIDANVDLAKDQAFTKPTIGEEFSGSFTKAGQLFFDTTFNILYGNVDKDPEADFEIELSGVTKLVAGDFVL